MVEERHVVHQHYINSVQERCTSVTWCRSTLQERSVIRKAAVVSHENPGPAADNPDNPPDNAPDNPPDNPDNPDNPGNPDTLIMALLF